MSDENENAFWSRIAKATSPRRALGRWNEQRAAIHARIHPHRPRSRVKWVFIAAPAFAAAAFFFHNYKNTPKPTPPLKVAKIPAKTQKQAPTVIPEDENWDVRATAVVGEVVVTAPDGTDSLLSTDAPLEAGDKIEVPPDGSLEIAFAADSVMTFGAGARLTVGSIKKKDSFFDMTIGTLVAKLNWAKRRGYRMRIRTPTAVAAVRGTEFAVEVQEDGVTDIGVFDEGKIAVTDRREPETREQMVTERQEIRFEARQTRGKAVKIKKMTRLARHSQKIKRLNGRQRHFKKNWKRMSPEMRKKLRKDRIRRPDGPWKEKLRKRREQRKRLRGKGAKNMRQRGGRKALRGKGNRENKRGAGQRGKRQQGRKGSKAQGRPSRGQRGQQRGGNSGAQKRQGRSQRGQTGRRGATQQRQGSAQRGQTGGRSGIQKKQGSAQRGSRGGEKGQKRGGTQQRRPGGMQRGAPPGGRSGQRQRGSSGRGSGGRRGGGRRGGGRRR